MTVLPIGCSVNDPFSWQFTSDYSSTFTHPLLSSGITAFCRSLSPFTKQRALSHTHIQLSGTAVLTACCWVQFVILIKLRVWHSPAVPRTVRERGRKEDLVHVWQPTLERELLTRWCLNSLVHPLYMYVISWCISWRLLHVRASEPMRMFTCGDI